MLKSIKINKIFNSDTLVFGKKNTTAGKVALLYHNKYGW